MPFDLDLALVRDFGTALLLGGLLGVEREKRNTREPGTMGLRSFVLVSQLGAAGGYLGVKLSMPWILPVVVLTTAGIVVTGYLASLKKSPDSTGLTTELAAVVMCLLGALATTGHRELAVGLGVITAALLAYKKPLHSLVGRIAWDDVLAGVRLLLATFVVLPLLPDETVDPWGVVNPHKLWLLVLLISGLSLVGYVVTRWLGPGKGVAATAAAGGIVSSTAVTLTFTKLSHERAASPTQLAGGILLAWGIMFVRVLVTATVVCPPLLGQLAWSFGAMALASGVAALLCLAPKVARGVTVTDAVAIKNPFSLWAASKFAALFAVVQVLLRLGQEYLPSSGIYAVAAVAGLTDVDAVTLSMAERARAVPDESAIAVVAIAIGAVSNTLVKAGMASLMGSGLLRPVLLGTGAIFTAGAIGLLVG